MKAKRRSVMTEYKWHEVYKAALLETDWSKMEERINAAEAALHARKHEFDLNHGWNARRKSSYRGCFASAGRSPNRFSHVARIETC